MDIHSLAEQEWLDADGLGGFASGTAAGIRTRRYHALLLHATNPPAGRMVLVNGIEAWVELNDQKLPISSQLYAPDVTHPDGAERIIAFDHEPWPTWCYRIGDLELTQEVITRHEQNETLLRWRLRKPFGGARLVVRPLLSGRDYHSLHRENPGFRFDAEVTGPAVTWRLYSGVPAVQALSNGAYRHAPDWYRNFLYDEEKRRGLDCIEDLASPGEFSFGLECEALFILRALPANASTEAPAMDVPSYARAAFGTEQRRRAAFATPLDRAADAYLARRGEGKTIVAGYPWFTDWGRDTFIALRGLCIARGELGTARSILLEWAGAVAQGMLPNRFPDGGESPEYNSVDASLWYVVAVHDYLKAAEARHGPLEIEAVARLRRACETIVEGYARGTRFGIRMDEDGLLSAGTAGVQLTWMDAKIGDWVVTPRIGKPVEVQALWLNVLRIVSHWQPEWESVFERGLRSFRRRFRRQDGCGLYDVIDVDHVPERVDLAIRPNQIFAVGGLPFPLLEGDDARVVVELVETELLTPLGLRSLAPGESNYRPHYEGGVWERDAAYHQGTVWPWLIGPFVEAWLRVRDNTPVAKAEARSRFLQPLLDHLATAGLGHVSEVTSADPPHRPGGCPFQAWSVGELIRMLQLTMPGTITETRRRAAAVPA